MIIYLVWYNCGAWEPDELIGIYSTREKAQERVDKEPDTYITVETVDSGEITNESK